MEGLPKILDFGYFALIWWQIDKKQEILKWSCKDLFVWTELLIILLIIGSDNNIEVNGAFAIHIIVHNTLIQNRKRLTFWIKILKWVSTY